MKKRNRKTTDGISSEYDFSKMKFVGRGIYAKKFRAGTNLVRLDADVRKAFPDEKAVNDALRTVAKHARSQSTRKTGDQTSKASTRSRQTA